MTAAEPYTQEEADEVRRLAEQGLSDAQIAKTTGKSRRRVVGIRQKFDIASRLPQGRKRTERGYQTPLHPAELAHLRRLVGYKPAGPS